MKSRSTLVKSGSLHSFSAQQHNLIETAVPVSIESWHLQAIFKCQNVIKCHSRHNGMLWTAKMISSLCSELWTLAFPVASCLMAFCSFPSPSPVFPSPWDKERKNMKELSVGAVEEIGGESISESISGSFWNFQSSHRGNKTFHSHVPPV